MDVVPDTWKIHFSLVSYLDHFYSYIYSSLSVSKDYFKNENIFVSLIKNNWIVEINYTFVKRRRNLIFRGSTFDIPSMKERRSREKFSGHVIRWFSSFCYLSEPLTYIVMKGPINHAVCREHYADACKSFFWSLDHERNIFTMHAYGWWEHLWNSMRMMPWTNRLLFVNTRKLTFLQLVPIVR